jgi:hypothetical protein
MVPAPTSDLLAAWERGLACAGPDRALLLHGVAQPQAGPAVLAQVPVGTRDADLYALRRALFGDRMEVLAECAACGEALEFDLDAGDLAARRPAAAGNEPRRVAVDGWDVMFRLPAAGDLTAAAAEAADAADARRRLVARCVLAASRDGDRADPDDLPEPVRRRLAEEAAQADPLAEVTLRVACPGCGASTAAELDIAGFLWVEVDAWARELLLDVHLLACAYGWTEPQVLALSPLRRRYYLELCADA